jgi:hypothetical protein
VFVLGPLGFASSCWSRPKPTYSTMSPSARPSLLTATGIDGVFAGALNWSMQKSSIGAVAFPL